MSYSSRLLQVGSTVTSLGATLSIGYYIYGLSNNAPFWNLPGRIGAIITFIGIVILLLGLFFPSREENFPSMQSQKSGHSSKNYQAGRDIVFSRKDADE